MKKLVLFVCLLVATVAAQAQFEKGKWIVNPSISGLGLSHNTDTDKTSLASKPRVVHSCWIMWRCWYMQGLPGTMVVRIRMSILSV